MENTKIHKIYLNITNTLINFLYSALEAVGRSDMYYCWEPGVYYIPEYLGISKSEFWNTIDLKGYKFWVDMPELPLWKSLWGKLEALSEDIGAELYIVVNPTLNPIHVFGQYLKVADLFGRSFTHTVATTDKSVLAHPNAVYIDVSEAMVIKVKEAGGNALEYPTLMNSYKCNITEDMIDDLINNIRGMHEE